MPDRGHSDYFIKGTPVPGTGLPSEVHLNIKQESTSNNNDRWHTVSDDRSVVGFAVRRAHGERYASFEARITIVRASRAVDSREDGQQQNQRQSGHRIDDLKIANSATRRES